MLRPNPIQYTREGGNEGEREEETGALMEEESSGEQRPCDERETEREREGE